MYTLSGSIELLFDWNSIECIYMIPCIIAISLSPKCSFHIRDPKSSKTVSTSTVLTLDSEGEYALQNLKNEAPHNEENILYSVMTSGTSSSPKIVKVPSSCFWPNVQDFCQLFKLSKKDTIFSASPPSFDPFYLDVFVACLSKSTLLLTYYYLYRTRTITDRRNY